MRSASSALRMRARATWTVAAIAARSALRRGRESDRAGIGGCVAWAELLPTCEPEDLLGERAATSCHRIASVAFLR